MPEWVVTSLWWLAFGGSHVALSWTPVRKPLVSRLGQSGFIALYSLIAIATFAGLAHHVALHRFDDPHPSLFATIPPVRGALLALSALGFSFFIVAVVVYPGLPMAAFRHRAMPARGVQQLTRHPFFSGIALWAGAHALLAPSRVSFVFFVGAVVLCIVGGLHQDRRLIAELGEPYRNYVASTSFWPFVAVATKRQRVRWSEQPWLAYALGVGVSLGLYQVHAHIFDHEGAYVVGVVALGSIAALLSSRMRLGRKRGREDV
jgi:uncharacterized membrane protein